MARNDEILDATRHTPVDVALARVAARQHGVVSLAQLRELGLASSTVRSRALAGRLHRVHRGVYAVGHSRLTAEGRYLAAVLACGDGAALSHRSAGAHRGLRRSSRAAIDVIAPGRRGRARAGIDVHSGATLEPQDVTIVGGIPCTSVARTLLDLAGVLDRQALQRAIAEAEVQRVFDRAAVEEVLCRARGRRSARLLQAALAAYDPGAERSRSDTERRLLEICRAAGLPRPLVNAPIELDGERVEADFVWPRQRLVVETDGWRTHGTRRAFERDRRRDRRLLLARWRVVRFSARQVSDDAAEVAQTLGALLHITATAT